ncbi:isoleucine--tRNA ligase [Candidatus Bathyarchaeota archaeon]|nr:MAG: isoleucine--tRNA ligase [Candidatus Bathyarchaeota archaeon]
MFKEIDSSLNFPELEHRILKFWEETDAFRKRREMNRGKKRWSFIDGPITANNPMGVHHAWGRTYKDLFHRYKAMRGFDTRYQNGFDCQGLWVEVEVERELGFKSKKDIEAYGIAEFVKKCKQRVLRYAAVQTEQSIRLGYWMDWNDPEELRMLAEKLEDPDQVITLQGPQGPVTGRVEMLVGRLGSPELGGSYFTFSDENNYMIWAFLKKCHERGLIYKGRDVMPWCPRCSTALSQHEIVTEGYREITHPSVFVKFPLRGREGESLLIWTTTPWTLTSNVAVAVHPDLTYVKVRREGEILYLAKGTLPSVFPDGDYQVLEELRGAEMEGWIYDGPFDELPAEQRSGAVEAHRVILWEEVSEEEGTGLVHIAPGCGKEDFELSKRYGLPAVAPLDDFGVFIEGFGWLTGTHVYDSAEPIIENLKEKGLLVRREDYTHRYPVCWRCGSELVFRLVDEWFISMGKKLGKPLEEVTEEEKRENLRYQIMEVAKRVRWIPEFGLKQEMDWLMNMEDWMISKKRYWGLALPIWECPNCGHFEVIGSKEELREKAVEGWEEFEGHTPHRPWVDKVKIRCPKCGSLASRIPDVGNPWLDAGIVAYSTLNYRRDREYWRKWFPADLVTECFPGQFRNWFYAMLTMSTVMEGETPFKTCLGHGLVLGEDGREMHKSWGNAIFFDEAAETMGADVMRWMYCTTRPESNLLFGYKRADQVKREFFIPLINVANFFAIYANLDHWTPEKSSEEYTPLDRWILSKLHRLIQEVTEGLEDYNPYTPALRIQAFVDDLSKWYVRRSRRRFWKSEDDVDKRVAYTTLYTCLKTLLKLIAPFTPFIAEALYQNLVRSAEPEAPESVHHNDWPTADPSMIDEDLMEAMDLAILASSLGRSARNKAGIKLRQPLLEAKVLAEEGLLEKLRPLEELVRDELNVKRLVLTNDEEEVFEYEVRPLSHILGKKHGRLFPRIKEAFSKMDARSLASRFLKGEGVEVSVGGKAIRVLPEEVEVQRRPREGYVVAEDPRMVVAIWVEISEELRREGLARDVVRRIQYLRKEAGFQIDDYIETYYEAPPQLAEVFQIHSDYISAETLSKALIEGEPPEGAHTAEFEIDGMRLRLGLVKIEEKA